MRRLLRGLRARIDEKGISLPLVGVSLLTLFWFAALGTDLGWFYVNAQRVQRAADGAALGGVIYLPGNATQAATTAADVAARNGFSDQAGDSTSGVFPQVEVAQVDSTQIEVRVFDEVNTFFLNVFGIDSFVVSRKATAEYIPPLRLGSPFNTFGNDPTCYTSDPNRCAGNFWANIHGYHTDTKMGDAYSSFCEDGDGSGPNTCDQNPSWRPEGYLYGLIPASSSFTLQELDIEFRNESGGVANADPHRTGDHNNFCSGSCEGPTTFVRVYAPDPTPLDLSDNGAPICSATYAPTAQIDPDVDPPYAGWGEPWGTVCTVGSATPGAIYVVQVVMEQGGNVDDDDGLNRYSLRTTNNGDKLFGLGDFSLFNNASGTNTSFNVAEVPDLYAGKTFVIELYDPGDANPGGTVQLWGPDGAITAWPGGCRMFMRDEVTDPWVNQGTRTPCQFNADGTFDGEWVKLEIDLPDTYSCTDCWWRVNYNYPGTVQDTTTWRAYIEGNPIHLIRNN